MSETVRPHSPKDTSPTPDAPPARIPFPARTKAWLMQVTFPLIRPSRALYFATRRIEKPTAVMVATRHGAIRCLVYRPHPDAPLAAGAERPPVHLQIHGGAFIGRFPEQDTHIANYIASEVGAYVVSVDYDVAPQRQFPVAEHECYDALLWVAANADRFGWDADRISTGGGSAGAKLAINVAQQTAWEHGPALRALFTYFGTIDVTRTDRTSSKRRPTVPPWMQRLVADTYFPDPAVRAEPLASPSQDARLIETLPATMILTGGLDTLGPEMDRLAAQMQAAAADVTYHRFEDADHGFTHFKPVETARAAITMLGDHLLRHL